MMGESALAETELEYEDDSLDLGGAVGDIVLPYQGEDWEFANDSNQAMRYIESININREDQVPFSLQELASFYYNPMLERSELYADRFLENSANVNAEFERLIKVLEKAIEATAKHRVEVDDKNTVIQSLCQGVYNTKAEQCKADGYCQDKYKVSTVHRYNVCSYNESVAAELNLALTHCQHLMVDDGTFVLYTKTFAQLQCAQFLCDAATNARHHIAKMALNTDLLKSSVLVKLADESIDVIRQCINTMFKYVRKNDEEDSFSSCLKVWITSLVCLLYELARESSYQHLAGEEQFILNHIIRASPKTQNWATQLVQMTFPFRLGDTREQKFFIDHVIYLLFLILRAPKGRDNFLKESKSLNKLRSLSDDTNEWIFVEDSGEYLKGVGSQWHVLPKESDMVSLYQQVPFGQMLSNILDLKSNEDGSYTFKDTDICSNKFLYVIACCDVMCDILGEGLSTLGTPKYKQLVRRIGQTLRNIVILIAQYWNFYKREVVRCPQPHSIQRLQTEFDELVKRCVERLLTVAQLGVYQFLADLPYKDVSTRGAETIYVLMNVPAGSRVEVDHLVTTRYSRQEWLDFVQDSDTKLAFEDHLSSMPENEIVYLLTTFCNLACSQPNSEDHLINIIATDLYTISFIYSSTRDICCKMGRELLCSLASVHPFVISTILQHIGAAGKDISPHAFYAISDLPFNQWHPTRDDLDMLRLWILNTSTPSVFGKLVPIILKSLNFGKTDEGYLFLSHDLHCDIALLLIEITKLHEIESKDGGVLMKGLDKVSRVAYAMRTSISADGGFQSWVWNVLLRLKLNRFHLKSSQSEFLDKPAPLPDFNESALLSKSISEKMPEACYVVIMVSNVGHSMNVFLQHGIQILKILADSTYKNAAVVCLTMIVEMFMKGGIDLSINSGFVDVLRVCLASPQSMISNITSKIVVCDHEIPEHLKLLMGLVSESLLRHDHEYFLSYWLKLIVSIPSWWEVGDFKITLNFLLKCAFNSTPECSFAVQEIIYSKQVELMQSQKDRTSLKHQNRSVISSILTYVGAENSSNIISFLQIPSSDFPYLSFYILSAEERYENETQLWSSVITLVNTNSVQSALKKAASNLRLSYKPVPLQLAIYRWARFVLATGEDHPTLPIICQKFFLRFIYIDRTKGSSVGSKFFSSHDIDTFNKLKSKFSSLSTGKINNGKSSAEQILLDLYRTFEVWLDEDKIHDSHLYLPSLPAHYQPNLLASVRVQSQTLWTQYVNFRIINEEILQASKFSVNFLAEKWKSIPPSASSHVASGLKISHLLKQFEPPVALDLTPATEISFPILVDQLAVSEPENLYDSIKSDVKSLLTHAQYFTDSVNKLDNLNAEYMELLPDLYSNELQRRLVKIECQSAFSPTHSCAGPAQVQLQYLEKTLNVVVSENLKKNREKCRTVTDGISREAASEDFGYSAVHLITVVQALVEKLRSAMQSQDDRKKLMECGGNLFFELADLNSDERWSYPPSKHLLLTSIDLLGQSFIFGQPNQAVPLLEQMLKRPELAAVLSTHFSPGSSCQRVTGGSTLHSEFDTAVFAQMYKRIVTASSQGKNSDVLFVLITKFDLESWCTDYNPPKSERITLLESVMSGLKLQYAQSLHNSNGMAIPKSLSMHLSSSAVQEVFITHLQILVKYSADLIFFEGVKSLLSASKEMKIDPKVWTAIIDTGILSVDNAANPVPISYDCVENCIKYLAVFFTEERRITKASLYASWEQYVSVLSILLHVLVKFEIDFNEKLKSAGHMQYLSHNDLLSNRVLPLFLPWISVVHSDGDESIGFPWTAEQQSVASHILNAMTSLVNELCLAKTWDVPQCVSTLWVFYLENTIIGVNEFTPEYIVASYQSINCDLPWNTFIPNLADLDKMVQLCHTNLNCVFHYLCNVLPKINWSRIIDMCKINDKASWVGHTGELLSYFLQVLLYLGSDENRLKTYGDLADLLSSASSFPWHLVGFDELELLTNITTDRYNALSVVYDPCNNLLQSPRHRVFKLLLLASGVPQTETEVCNFNLDDEQSPGLVQVTWMKRQSLVRCVGNLIRSASKTTTQKDISLLETAAANLIDQTMKSILLIVKYDKSVNEITLMSLCTEFWKIISKFHQTLKEVAVSVTLKFLSDVLNTCDATYNVNVDCNNSDVQSNSLVLLCTLSAAFHIITDTKMLSVISENCLHLSLVHGKLCAVKSPDNENINTELDSTLWATLRHALLEYGRLPQASYLESCCTNSSLLSLLALAQNLFDSTQAVSAGERISLQGLTHMLIEWIPKICPKTDCEEKIILFLAYLFKIYRQIERNGSLHPNEQIELDFAAENLALLIPTLEQWGIDRVKTGILGSLGIGRASQLSVGFRISVKITACYILAIQCKIHPTNEEILKKFSVCKENIQKLPSISHVYGEERRNIGSLLDLIQAYSQEQDVCKMLFDKLFSFYFVKNRYLLILLQ